MAVCVKTTPKRKKIPEYLRQIFIISWKNLLLLRQNKKGLICEIVFSSLFTVTFFVLVFNSLTSFTNETRTSTSDVLTQLFSKTTQFYYYYPNNSFIESIANKSLNIMQKTSPMLNLKLKGVVVENAESFNKYDLSNLFCFVSFPSSYNSNINLLDSIQYSIYTSEYVLINHYNIKN
jgi:hypothetical protein